MLLMMARVMKYATNGLQGNIAKTPQTTSKNHFKRTISVLMYILYCANFVNWTNSSSVIAVKAISKLDPFNNVTEFMNGHFRREHYHDLLHSFNGGGGGGGNSNNTHNAGKQTVLSEDVGNEASILLTPLQRTSKQTKTSTKLFAHSKLDNSLRRMRRSSSSTYHSFYPSSNNAETMEIKIVNSPIKIQRKLCGVDGVGKNKLKNLIKWKIRKKLAKCSPSQTNKIKRSVNDTATTATTFTNNSTLMATNYNTTQSIMTTTEKSIRSQFQSTIAFNSRNIPEITTPFTTNDAITTINSITQIGSSNRPIKSQQQSLHRSRETNVFEMATKLKYNKLAKSTVIPDESRKGKISLLGLFELSTRYGLRTEGQSELAAAQMAVRHINSKHILNGYTIELLTNDTKVCAHIINI